MESVNIERLNVRTMEVGTLDAAIGTSLKAAENGDGLTIYMRVGLQMIQKSFIFLNLSVIRYGYMTVSIIRLFLYEAKIFTTQYVNN